MTIFRTEHKKNYTVVNNFICKDSRISWKAKGIWLYAFSRPDDWSFNLEDLIKQSSDGKESVRSGLIELEEFGYLVRSRFRSADGKMMSGAEWVFYETPQQKSPSTNDSEPEPENPNLDNPNLDLAILENQPLLSTDTIPSPETTQPSIENNNKQVVVVPQKSGDFVKDDLYFACAKLNEDWTSYEMEDAFKIYYASRETVSDPLKYIRAIINKKRIIQSSKETSCHTKKQIQSKNCESSKKSSEIGKQPSLENVTEAHPLANFSCLHKMRLKLGIS